MCVKSFGFLPPIVIQITTIYRIVFLGQECVGNALLIKDTCLLVHDNAVLLIVGVYVCFDLAFLFFIMLPLTV